MIRIIYKKKIYDLLLLIVTDLRLGVARSNIGFLGFVDCALVGTWSC